MKYYLLFSFLLIVGVKSFAQTKPDTVKCIMIIYSKVSSGYDSLAHARFSDTLGKQMERGWVIVPHGTPTPKGKDIDAETAGYLLLDKRPTHKHVAKAVYFNW